jgi:hypothetical protein
MKGRKILRFRLEELPKPMLEDGFRSLAVTGKPVEAHLSVQCLVIVRQRLPFGEGQVNQPHVRGAHVLQESLAKDEKVTSVLHVRTGVRDGQEDDDFKEFHTIRGRGAQSLAKVIGSGGPRGCGRSDRSAMRPKTRGTSAAGWRRSGVRRNFFVVVATGWHSVGARTGNSENSSFGTIATALVQA